MYAANTYVIRMATDEDTVTLHRLAELDSSGPLTGPVVVGEIRGATVAALSLTQNRAISDPFIPTAHLLGAMRARARGIVAFERTPSLRERIRDAVPAPARRAA